MKKKKMKKITHRIRALLEKEQDNIVWHRAIRQELHGKMQCSKPSLGNRGIGIDATFWDDCACSLKVVTVHLTQRGNLEGLG